LKRCISEVGPRPRRSIARLDGRLRSNLFRRPLAVQGAHRFTCRQQGRGTLEQLSANFRRVAHPGRTSGGQRLRRLSSTEGRNRFLLGEGCVNGRDCRCFYYNGGRLDPGTVVLWSPSNSARGIANRGNSSTKNHPGCPTGLPSGKFVSTRFPRRQCCNLAAKGRLPLGRVAGKQKRNTKEKEKAHWLRGKG